MAMALTHTYHQDFPELRQEVNGHPLTYLDSAASSLMPESVIETINQYHRTAHANVHRGVHTLSQAATDDYELTRDRVQALLSASQREEIIFTYGATDSINLVAQTWGREHLSKGDAILITEMEHHANIVPWQQIAQERGCIIHKVPITPEGEIDLEVYQTLLENEPVRVVALIHASNALGTVNPVKEMIANAHDHGAIVMLDGAQSAPHFAVDVQSLNCDFYTFSAHKLCGPTGFGILYGKMEHLETMPPFRGGGSMIEHVAIESSTYQRPPLRFEPGTPSIAAGIGFGAAVDYLMDIGMDTIASIEHKLLIEAQSRLSSLPKTTIIGSPKERIAVLPLHFEGIHPYDMGMFLDRRGIAVRTGHHCAQPLTEYYQIAGTVRCSLTFYNTIEDIDRFVTAIEEGLEFFS